jgi:hypothetical protein
MNGAFILQLIIQLAIKQKGATHQEQMHHTSKNKLLSPDYTAGKFLRIRGYIASARAAPSAVQVVGLSTR